MATNMQVQIFRTFLGEEEGIRPLMLPEVFGSGGSNNVYIDDLGRTRRVGGYAAQNSAVTTNTGGSDTLIRSLLPYRDVSGGSVTRTLFGAFDDATNEWELWKSTDSGVNWTFLEDLGSGSINRIADGAQYQNNYFITNGVMAPRKWNGSALSTAGLTQAPTPTASESSSGGNLNGNYKYKLVNRSNDGTRSAGSVASSEIPLTNKQMDLSWSASGDTNVVGYEIYRTTGVGSVYYFVYFSDGRTTPTTYTDNVPDSVILGNRALQEHGDPPPSGAYWVEPHKDRMWWGRTDTYPWRIWYSDVGLPESVGLLSYINLQDPDTSGDVVTGMVGEYEGKLIAFTERAVWSISGSGAILSGVVDFRRRRTNASIGSVSARTAVKVPAGAIYRGPSGNAIQTDKVMVAYLTPNKDIRLFDGENDVIISTAVKDTLDDLVYAQRAKCCAVVDHTRGQVIWAVPTSGTEPNKAVVWNYQLGVWYVWSNFNFSSLASIESSSVANILLGGSSGSGSTDGIVYQLFSGNTQFGSAIASQWMSNTFWGRLGEDTTGRESALPAIPFTKRWRWVDVVVSNDTDADLTLSWYRGSAEDSATAIATAALNHSTAVTDTGREMVTHRVILHDGTGRFLHDQGIRFKISHSGSSNNPWSLEGLALGFQILPGLGRRSP